MSDVITKSKIATLRKKVRAGTATALERSMVEQWEKDHPRGRPKSKTDASDASPTSGPGERAGGEASVSADSNSTPEIHSTLPGSGTVPVDLPPINVNPTGPLPNHNASGAANSSGPSAAGPSSTAHSAPNAGTNGNNQSPPKAPQMSPQEAEAGARMIADMATKVLGEFNDYNGNHGKPKLGEQLLGLFHFSVKRMCMKYGAAIDEDTFDGAVIVGMGGFVGFQSYRVYKEEKEKQGFGEAGKSAAAPNHNVQSKPQEPIREKEVRPNVQPNPIPTPNGEAHRPGPIVPYRYSDTVAAAIGAVSRKS